MRMIGHLTGQAEAQAFGDFLYVQGIDNQVEVDKDPLWSIWVHSEDQLEQAKRLLEEFRTNPADSKYRRASAEAGRMRANTERSNQAYQKKVLDGSRLWRGTLTYGYGLLTLGLITVCGAVFFLSKFGGDLRAVHSLFIAEQLSSPGVASRLGALTEIAHGQLWRLVTPVFLHFTILHLFFNMLWLLDLGSMIEANQGRVKYLVLFLGLAVFSNLAQYIVGGPTFGGMSGVVYGLLGYVWIRGKFDPLSGLFVHPSTVVMMIIWFFLCLSGAIGHVANTAHAAGLLLGMGWGYTAARMNQR